MSFPDLERNVVASKALQFVYDEVEVLSDASGEPYQKGYNK